MIFSEDWRPADGMELEAAALQAIRAPDNTLVVAGPGSGKTELLAQKACFLLQTQRCPPPKRILAISFKVDAAYNLKDRVHRRCGPALSKRFDSFTFDAFAKRILDRFHLGLPQPYRIAEYDVNVKMAASIAEAFKAVDLNFWATYPVGEGNYERFLASRQLPADGDNWPSRVVRGVWQYLLRKQKPDLSFGMIMRLAELIIATNPLVKRYLQRTYSHIFLDEFQDTTFAQYDLLSTCFAGSDLSFTAVGDDKQTIMSYAGARPDIFDVYREAFNAREIALVMNWRSAPKLIRFQNYLVAELLQKPAVAVAAAGLDQNAGEARMCFFPDPTAEQRYLLDQLRGWMAADGLTPRDICVLVKQQPGEYTGQLVAYLTANGIPARDETELQGLLVEPVPLFLLNVLEVVFSGRYGKPFEELVNFIRFVNQSYSDEDMVKLNRGLIRLVKELRKQYNEADQRMSADKIAQIMKKAVDFVGAKPIKEGYPQYKRGTWLKQLVGQLYKILGSKLEETGGMMTAIGALRGNETIPVMTAHKSKGLEFHTVVFVGLEDGAFWSYQNQQINDNNLVFVALSRAKQRIVFTFSAVRYLRNRLRPQSAESIARIHNLISSYPDVVVVDQIGLDVERIRD